MYSLQSRPTSLRSDHAQFVLSFVNLLDIGQCVLLPHVTYTHLYTYIYIYQGAPRADSGQDGFVFFRSRLYWVTFVKHFHGSARVGLGQVSRQPGFGQVGFVRFENLLEGDRSGFEAIMPSSSSAP